MLMATCGPTNVWWKKPYRRLYDVSTELNSGHKKMWPELKHSCIWFQGHKR